MKISLLFSALLISSAALAQNYTSYRVGSPTDAVKQASGGLCLMGGATEDDNAMKWFLNRANGGDVLVLRATGSDGYNDYFFSDLGVTLNSVETIVFNDATANAESYIHQRIFEAEAIWIAGGDQFDYISYWRNTSISFLINQSVSQRKAVLGGTSAGMAIQGKYYFSAENGSVTSAEALANPYGALVTVDSTDFLQNNHMQNVITDTHFDDPDRKGRFTVFLARILTDYGVEARGIACEEYTAVCIDTNGLAKVYGEIPAEDFAYFVQINCANSPNGPETCESGSPLNWMHNEEALVTYKVPGTSSGANTFDLNDWLTGNGGTWQYWSADQGTFGSISAPALNCSSNNEDMLVSTISIQPNPVQSRLTITATASAVQNCKIYNALGALVLTENNLSSFHINIDVSSLTPGLYIIEVQTNNGSSTQRFVKE